MSTRVHDFILRRQMLVWLPCHCYWLLAILQTAVVILACTWSIPQSIAFNQLQLCSVQNASTYTQTSCDSTCYCSSTPLAVIINTPMCSALNDNTPSGTKCNYGYRCCSYCCDTCSTCVQGRCATYRCNCRCCRSTDNDYCTWQCSERIMYRCTMGPPINGMVNSSVSCAIGDLWRCDDTSVVFYTSVLPWWLYGLPLMLTGAVVLMLVVYLFYRSSVTQVAVDIAMNEIVTSL